MHVISPEQYEQLRAGAQVIEADSHGEKVLRLADGNYLKLFRRKRLLSSALLWPYARRFASNARQLARLGIPCPQVIALYKLKTPRRDIVHYQPLPGRTLRQLRDASQPLPEGLFEQFGRFMAELHQQGVYFRSAHLGNVVLTPEGRLGLIDIADLRRQRRPLNRALRLRNFRHMLRDTGDRAWLAADPQQGFVRGYRTGSGLSSLEIPGLD